MLNRAELPFGRTYSGAEALEVLRLSINMPRVLLLSRDILETSYAIYVGEGGRCFIRERFAELQEGLRGGWDGTTLQRFGAQCRAEAARLGIAVREDNLYKEASLLRSLELAGREEIKGNLLDIGANDNRLGMTALRFCPHLDVVLGVDVKSYRPLSDGIRLLFRLQDDPGSLPCDSGWADIVIMRYCLHHMPFNVQGSILKEAARVLRRNGKLIIFEDTFAKDGAPLVANSFSSRFRELATLEQMVLLAFSDASSCLVVNEEMPFCFSFRTMEDWASIAGELGLRVGRMVNWGIPFFSLHQALFGQINLVRT